MTCSKLWCRCSVRPISNGVFAKAAQATYQTHFRIAAGHWPLSVQFSTMATQKNLTTIVSNCTDGQSKFQPNPKPSIFLALLGFYTGFLALVYSNLEWFSHAEPLIYLVNSPQAHFRMRSCGSLWMGEPPSKIGACRMNPLAELLVVSVSLALVLIVLCSELELPWDSVSTRALL